MKALINDRLNELKSKLSEEQRPKLTKKLNTHKIFELLSRISELERLKKLIPILLIILASCSPQKRINRIVKKHPELLVADTIRVIDTLVIEAVHFDTIIKVNQDVSGVDSILNSFKGKIDSITNLKLSNDIKYYITQRKTIEDTLYHFQDDLEVLIWEDENGINVKVNKPEQEIIREVLVPYQQIKTVKKHSFNWFLIGLLIGFILIVLINKLTK